MKVITGVTVNVKTGKKEHRSIELTAEGETERAKAAAETEADELKMEFFIDKAKKEKEAENAEFDKWKDDKG